MSQEIKERKILMARAKEMDTLAQGTCIETVADIKSGAANDQGQGRQTSNQRVAQMLHSSNPDKTIWKVGQSLVMSMEIARIPHEF